MEEIMSEMNNEDDMVTRTQEEHDEFPHYAAEDVNPTLLATIASSAASSVKAENTIVFDVSRLATITEIMMITQGRNERHVLAIAEEIEKRISQECLHRIPESREGLTHAQWILLDYGDLVIHVMDEESRSFYALERLWSDQPHFTFDDEHEKLVKTVNN